MYFIRGEFVSKKNYIFFVPKLARYLQILVAVQCHSHSLLTAKILLLNTHCMENMRGVHKNHRAAGKRTLRYQTFSFLSSCRSYYYTLWLPAIVSMRYCGIDQCALHNVQEQWMGSFRQQKPPML